MCTCAWQLQKFRVLHQGLFFWLHSLWQYELWSDARRHSAASATGKWSFGVSVVLLLCFGTYMVLYVLCYSCANRHFLDFTDVCNTALPVLSSVHVSLSPFKVQECVQAHVNTPRNRYLCPIVQEQKGLIIRMLKAVNSVIWDASHLLKNFYLTKEEKTQ